MINFDEYPLKNVIRILMRNLKTDKLSDVKIRAQKSADEKFFRTRKNAEVFTPTKIVKFMVDALDDGLIESTWLEIACGEAPFITNRYDAESGEKIPFENRVGILDRKFRAIPADADKTFWAKCAVQSVYGYELQSDSLLIARANVLLSFAEFARDFGENDLVEVAEIISKNFWRADGLKIFCAEKDLFDDDFEVNDMKKFDFVIGNPPYQYETSGENKTFAPPVYNKFMEAAHKVGEKSVLITPARFLFDAGATPKDFNKKMLNDPHLKVLDYAPDASEYFKSVDIKGGVAITLRDETKNYGVIGTFVPFAELKTIHDKICIGNKNFRPFSEIVYPRADRRLSKKFFEDHPNSPLKNCDAIGTNAFNKTPEIFFDDKPADGYEYIQILGRQKNQRVFKWIRRDYVQSLDNLDKWKVFIPSSSGTGTLGEVIPTPLVGSPSVGSTETFTAVGAFDTREEAQACLAYIKSKLCRAMLGILKVTQHNPASTWAKVPLQDFTSASDINWTVSIPEIDKQLYKKYGLNDSEINFIETHVKAMD